MHTKDIVAGHQNQSRYTSKKLEARDSTQNNCNEI